MELPANVVLRYTHDDLVDGSQGELLFGKEVQANKYTFMLAPGNYRRSVANPVRASMKLNACTFMTG